MASTMYVPGRSRRSGFGLDLGFDVDLDSDLAAGVDFDFLGVVRGLDGADDGREGTDVAASMFSFSAHRTFWVALKDRVRILRALGVVFRPSSLVSGLDSYQ